MKKQLQIAIDGPAAAGKSTVAKIVADELAYVYIDTGAMYRSLAWKALQAGYDVQNGKALEDLLTSTKITLNPVKNGSQKVEVNGQNVTEDIRTEKVTNNVSHVAGHPEVRKEMADRQRRLAELGGVVMDGRDIGSHVLPDAEVKVFLLASVEERAERRFNEQIKKGINTPIEQLKDEIRERDRLDSERKASPLLKAEDAVEIDTTSLTINEVAKKILNLVSERACLK